jgi:hypothetical protein
MAKTYSLFIMDYEDDIIIELRRRFMNCLFDETEGDEYKSVSFNLIYTKACAGEDTLKICDNNDDILKNLVKQDLVNKNYVLIDDSNEENMFLTPKGKQDYVKI